MNEAGAGTNPNVYDPRYEEFQARAKDTNVDTVTLLATDYLNHFNEIVMLLEMVPDMPEILDDAKEWRPKTYTDHFRASTIADKDLAIEAYPFVPSAYKEPFEQTVALIDELILGTVARLEADFAENGPEHIRDTAVLQSHNIQRLMDSASAIMHGSSATLDQDEIDSLMGR